MTEKSVMDLWLNQVRSEIGGCNELTQCIIQKIAVIQAGTTLSLLSRSKGVLLYGKPGTGKTAIATSIASNVYTWFHLISFFHLTC